MRLTFRKKTLLVFLALSLSMFCCSVDDARAQTSARQYSLLSSQSCNLGIYYIMLHWNLINRGYTDSSGYDILAYQCFMNAYSYATTATQYALQDYNNGVTATYYKAYMEYVTLNAMQSYLSTGINYIDQAQQTTNNATSYSYAKQAIDNIYYATTKYGPSIFWAGCEP